jgi:hypothetical protein
MLKKEDEREGASASQDNEEKNIQQQHKGNEP